MKYDIELGDCYDKLKNIPDNSVDFIFTDPPYNLTQYSTGNIKFKNRSDIKNEIADWDIGFDPEKLREDFLRLLKPTGNIFAFCSYNLIGRWHEIFDPLFNTFQFFVWHKTNPVPKRYKAGFLNSCEMIACMWNKKHTWNYGKHNEMHNFFESPICCGNERLSSPTHPTQKPIALLKHVIRIATNRKDIILDPFMGVGSTGVAALQLGRYFIGIEMDEVYFKAAEDRLKNSEEIIDPLVWENVDSENSKNSGELNARKNKWNSNTEVTF